MAYLMANDSSLAASPSALKSKLLSLALQGAVSGSAVDGDRKVLLNNGVTDPTGTEGILWRKKFARR